MRGLLYVPFTNHNVRRRNRSRIQTVHHRRRKTSVHRRNIPGRSLGRYLGHSLGRSLGRSNTRPASIPGRRTAIGRLRSNCRVHPPRPSAAPLPASVVW